MSRVLLGRHHLGDVIAGVIVGYINYELVRYIWVGEDDVLALRAEILALLAPLLSRGSTDAQTTEAAGQGGSEL